MIKEWFYTSVRRKANYIQITNPVHILGPLPACMHISYLLCPRFREGIHMQAFNE